MKKEWNQADIIDGTCDAGAFPSICVVSVKLDFCILAACNFT
jgi:hypothetical protein